MNIQYELYLKGNRETIDLRIFGVQITKAVLKYLPDSKVYVYKDYYQIDMEGDIPRKAAICIGRMISHTVPELRALVKEYKSKNEKHPNTRKLFRRRKKVRANG